MCLSISLKLYGGTYASPEGNKQLVCKPRPQETAPYMDPSTHQPKKGKECLGSGIHVEVEVKSLSKAKTGTNRLALGQR